MALPDVLPVQASPSVLTLDIFYMVTLMRLENDKIDLQKIMFKDLISNFNKKKQLIRKIEDIELIVEDDEIEIFQQFDPFGEIPP